MLNDFADKFSIALPDGWQQQIPETELNNDVDKMQFVLSLARWNIFNKVHGNSGGPFAAAVFETGTHKLISIGVNQVVPANCSLAHAEAVAIALAQQRLKSFDLSPANGQSYEMFASGQPCVQCFGMFWWSGINRLIIGARASDIEQIAGFDEGPLPSDWQTRLQNRTPLPSVTVLADVCRDDAKSVLQTYVDSGGTNYSPGLS